MKNEKQAQLNIVLLECIVTAALLLLSYFVAGKLIYNDLFPIDEGNKYMMLVILVGAGLFILGINQYFRFDPQQLAKTASKLVVFVIAYNFSIIALLYFVFPYTLSPHFFVIYGTMQFMLLFAFRRLSDRYLKGKVLRRHKVLIIGYASQEKDLGETIARHQIAGKTLYIDCDHPNIEEYLERADQVYLSDSLSQKRKDYWLARCISLHKKVSIVPQLYEISLHKSEMKQVGDTLVFQVENYQIRGIQSFLKRAMDIALSLVGIIVTSPLMLWAALRIKSEDKGPIFYRQERSGLNGKPFSIAKFRSMIVDAEKHTGAVFAAEEDPRITRIGKLMRATRIDELPQFFNVLKGEMSLIGPRPERPVFVESFSQEIPEYRNRLAVKPGVTGFAQVMGNYTTSAANKLKFDLFYIKNYSLLMDLKILLLTVKVVFTKEQAEGFSQQKKKAGIAKEQLAYVGNEATDFAVEKRTKRRNWKRAAAFACIGVLSCSIVISGSVIMRYSSLAMTVFEVFDQEVEQMLVGDAGNADDGMNPQDGQNGDTAGDGVDARNGQTNLGDNQLGAGPDNGGVPSTVDGQQGNNQADGQGQGANEGANPAGSNQGTEKAPVALSEGEVLEGTHEVPMTEKFSLAAKLISRISKEDLILLENMMRDGLTEEEKEVAKEMIYRHFDDDEILYIKELYGNLIE